MQYLGGRCGSSAVCMGSKFGHLAAQTMLARATQQGRHAGNRRGAINQVAYGARSLCNRSKVDV